MNRHLRDAIDNQPVSGDLEARLRARLSAEPSGQGRRPMWPAVACVALLVAGLGVSLYYTREKIGNLLRVGVSDHIHCAIAGAYPHQTQRVEMIEGLGPEFADMLQPVVDQVSAGRSIPDAVESAHRCTVNGRSYVHIVLRRDDMLISVILTKRSAAEVFPRAVAARVVHVSGISIHEDRLDGYSVSGFESGSWLGYVVSGLPLPENEALSARVAPVVRRFAL